MLLIYDKKSGFWDIPDFLFFSLFQSHIIITTRIIKHLPVYKEN